MNMNRVTNWEPVVSTFKRRLSKWKANTLSIAGRLTLIKSGLGSLPTYYFSLFKAPKKVIGDLEGLMRRFLWGGSEEVRKMSWVSWEIVTKRVVDGGLAMAPLEVNNNAMLIKWLWRFRNEPNALWRKVVTSIHGSSRSWGIAPCNNAIPGVWKNCVSFWNKHKVKGVGLNVIIHGKPGDGRRIRFWLDIWLGTEPLKNAFPLLFALEKSKRVLIHLRLKFNGGNRTICWEWSRIPFSPEEIQEKSSLENLLHAVILDGRDDTWEWSHGAYIGFEVAVVKSWLRGAPVSDAPFEFCWSSWVPTKCNIFMWRAFLDRLPTKLALARMLFMAMGVWNEISTWCKIPRPFVFYVNDLVHLLEHSGVSGVKKTIFHGIIIITCWRLWRARNDKLFNRKDPNVVELVAEIKSLGFLWYKYRFKGGVVDWTRWYMFDVT
ncbi:hypothetical protein HanHA300_Chr02g0058651 [Helianthus annuus]|nr:hypothetical protein HanHA300_Chr02g0058651 [Helianthus annuus]KAJ0777520.1 hypothetical protein HanLR1_Chr02g0061391 [Helianthus annuus]